MGIEKFRELVILLPCHSLEDFPVYSEGEEAEGLLAAWTALWHPGLINSAAPCPLGTGWTIRPRIWRLGCWSFPPFPTWSCPRGFVQRVKEAGGWPISPQTGPPGDRRQCPGGVWTTRLRWTTNWLREFYALGYAYLQVQILTRQMRYSSNLDEIHFANQVCRGRPRRGQPAMAGWPTRS